MKSVTERIDKYGRWALVAGGANGLGKAFCRTLAAAGKALIIVDNDTSNLQNTASEIRAEFDTEVLDRHLDLSMPQVWRELDKLIAEKGCRLVVYNAAYGPVRRFEANSEEEIDRYIDLNCRTLIKTAWAFIRHTNENQPRGFLAMSSLAGLRGTQLVAPYGASKAFTWNLIEALHYEMSGRNIDMSAVCAGTIATEAFESTGASRSRFAPRPMAPEDVAREALLNLHLGAIYIPGAANRRSNWILSRVLPRKMSLRLTNRVMGEMYRDLLKRQ